MYLLSLEFREGCDRVALDFNLVVREDVGHHAARRREADGLEGVEVRRELVEGVLEVVAEISGKLVVVATEAVLEVGIPEGQIRVEVEKVNEVIARVSILKEQYLK